MFEHFMEFMDEDGDSHLSHFDKLMEALISLYLDRIQRKKTDFQTERLYFINLLTQKFLLHGFSIKTLVPGVSFESKSRNFKTPITDPFSVNSLSRTLIETYLVQNYLSNRNCDKDLLEGRFDIWMRYGLTKRNLVPETDEEIRVSNLDKTSIQTLPEKIQKRNFFIKLSEESKKNFLKRIDTDWKFIFDGEKFYAVSWKRLIEESGVKSGINDQIYNYLSWHSHSQSISILQLKKMWDSGFDKISLRISIKKINMFTSFMISDIVHSDNEFKTSFDNLDVKLKEIVNFYMVSFRGIEYKI